MLVVIQGQPFLREQDPSGRRVGRRRRLLAARSLAFAGDAVGVVVMLTLALAGARRKGPRIAS
ncbi:MAG: hypothetical protein JNM48_11655 [Rhodospirillales bacterium]|nr:hypothetical protein [Rhodospirillales bacterium]